MYKLSHNVNFYTYYSFPFTAAYNNSQAYYISVSVTKLIVNYGNCCR